MKKNLLIVLLTSITINVFAQLFPFDSIPDNLKNRADAVVRTEQCLFTINGPGDAVRKIKKAVTLLNEDANGYRFLRVPYDKYSKVISLKGMVYDEKGNIIEALNLTDIYDMSAMSGGTFYSDDRIKILYFPLYKFPYTIEYEYEIAYSSLLNYPSWNFQDSPDVSVQRSGIQFVIPQNMKLRYYEEYMKNKVDSVVQNGQKIFTWQEENLPAYSSQDYAIRQVYHSPAVHTAPLDFEYAGYKGSMSSWEEFGNWVYKINRDRDALPQEDINAVKEIVSKTNDQKEKVKLIYEYMQSRTRYVSIQIAIGGYRTAEASDVSKNGFGDCKALVNYTYSLLKAAGINSIYTLVKAGSLTDLKKDFVDNQFNHVVLCVPIPKADTVWLECTSQTIPFNYLGSFTAGKNALLITPEGGKIVKTPALTKEQNKFIRNGSLFLNVLGAASGRISNNYSGYNFGLASSRYSMQSEEEIKRFLSSSLLFTDFNVSGISYTEKKSENPSSELVYQLNIKNFTTTNGSRMYFNPSVTVQDYLQETPLHLKIPVSDITSDSIVYTLPINYTVEFIPESIDVVNEFGRFFYSLEAKGDRLFLKRFLELHESEITTDNYNEFRNFINTIAKTDRNKIILIKRDV